jgi:tRNA(Leu) C34 or U34 (ribose-2'-O)-methylase TrmL
MPGLTYSGLPQTVNRSHLFGTPATGFPDGLTETASSAWISMPIDDEAMALSA